MRFVRLRFFLWVLFLGLGLQSALFGGAWSATENLSAAGVDASNHYVVLNSAGQVVVVWERGSEIQASTFTVGGSWSSPVSVSSEGDVASQPQVAINDVGQVVAMWKRESGGTFDVQVSTLQFGGSWSAPTSLIVLGADVNAPCVRINALGQTVSMWTRSDGTNFLVECATLTFGGVWSEVTALSAAGEDASVPRVALNDAGQVAAMWIRNDVVQARRSTFEGSWGAVSNLSTKPSVSAPLILFGDSGDVRASWRRTSGTWRIYEMALALFDGYWKTPLFISQSEKTLDHISFDISEDGKAVVSWNYLLGSDIVIYGVTYKVSIWDDVTLLSALGQNALSPRANVNNAGHVVVIWQRFDGSNQIIQARTKTI